MAIEKVREYFSQSGLADRILEFDVSSETVELAAQAIGCEEKQIAKSMSFLLHDQAILVVTSGDARISNPKFKEQFQTKAKMIHPDQVENLIGHDVGGVCPFGIHEDVAVYLDISLKRFDTVFPAAGSSNSVIELSLDELEQYSGATAWIDVCKDWE
jgi:prolyl-tRNA editing enzyme YbaK/EbsC (Cys-tRNA(Pro) deacylase)